LLGIWLVHSRPRQPAGPRQNRGAIGDALDSALAETTIGLYQTEIIAPRSPWNGLADVEIATLEYTDWHNHRRLHGACHDLTPAELERAYYSHKGGLPKEPVPTN
jgi:putative transposase